MCWARCTIVFFLWWSAAALSEPLSFSVRGYEVTQSVFSVFARPGEVVRLSFPQAADIRLLLEGEPAGTLVESRWQFTAPYRAGLYSLLLQDENSGARSTLNIFVGTYLRGGEEFIGDYLIGALPTAPAEHFDLYRQPRLYFEVTEDNLDTPVSDHFTLAQFLCKQESDFPKYVVIKESLLVLLEGLVRVVQEAGYPVETFGIISGYRTPHYNRELGNTPNSRHVYGDALDFFIDVDEDGEMDDLNRDGRRDAADVDLLYSLLEDAMDARDSGLPPGGLGRYYRNAYHGGFLHADARGYRARW